MICHTVEHQVIFLYEFLQYWSEEEITVFLKNVADAIQNDDSYTDKVNNTVQYMSFFFYELRSIFFICRRNCISDADSELGHIESQINIDDCDTKKDLLLALVGCCQQMLLKDDMLQ